MQLIDRVTSDKSGEVYTIVTRPFRRRHLLIQKFGQYVDVTMQSKIYRGTKKVTIWNSYGRFIASVNYCNDAPHPIGLFHLGVVRLISMADQPIAQFIINELNSYYPYMTAELPPEYGKKHIVTLALSLFPPDWREPDGTDAHSGAQSR